MRVLHGVQARDRNPAVGLVLARAEGRFDLIVIQSSLSGTKRDNDVFLKFAPGTMPEMAADRGQDGTERCTGYAAQAQGF